VEAAALAAVDGEVVVATAVAKVAQQTAQNQH